LKRGSREVLENYLKTIFLLSEEMGFEFAKTSEIATLLGVSQPSVTEMLQKLKKKGLIEYHPRKGAFLSEKGRKIVYKLIRRHRLAERLLTDVFELSPEKVDKIACAMEHIIDDELEKKLDEFLNYPETCPHGAPIPRNNRLPKAEGVMLSKVNAPATVEIIRVLDESAETLMILRELNISIGQRLKVTDALSDGSMLIEVYGIKHLISPKIATSLIVRVISNTSKK